MNAAPLVYTTRETAGRSGASSRTVMASAIENVHFGAIAVVSVDGEVLRSVGDPHWPTFTRSTLKPFQALSFVRDGGLSRFGWDSREVAMMCASHSGEAMHTGAVGAMLASADCDETHLQCGCHVPGWYAALGETPPVAAQWSPLENNCSGKHAGFLASCRMHGEAVDDYLDPDSPLQRRVAATIASVAGLAMHDLPAGTDGCSAPNYAMPLARLALLYARLAQGRAAPADGDALGVLFDAMTGHPGLVSGTARSDLALMASAPGDWVTKIGADGVQAIGIRSAGIGIAIKVAGGDREALYATVVEVLRQLDLPTDALLAGENRWYRMNLQNVRGLMTGKIIPAFTLGNA